MPPPCLDGLPAELIAEICKYFCHHCALRDEQRSDSTARAPSPHRPDHAATVALAHLSQTCTRINAIATPYLYHRPIFTSWWLLAQTLIARPDLALHVRYLFDKISCCTNARPLTLSSSANTFPPEVARHFKDAQMLSHATSAPSATMTPTDKETESIATLGAAEVRKWEVSESVGMLVSLCPNLEELVAITDSPTTFKWNFAGSLARLKHVDLLRHTAKDALSLALLWQLATVAPSLASFSCQNVRQNARSLPAIPTLPNLVKLRFNQTALCADTLRALLAACPSLQSLAFTASTPLRNVAPAEQFTPLQAYDAIVRFAPNLTSLALDMSPIYRWGFPVTDILQSLGDLSKLENLTLDLGCLVPYAHWLLTNCHHLVPVPDRMLLVDLLPASIRAVSMACHRPDHGGATVRHLYDSLLELASAAPERFPDLEYIAVSNFGGKGDPRKVIEGMKSAFETEPGNRNCII